MQTFLFTLQESLRNYPNERRNYFFSLLWMLAYFDHCLGETYNFFNDLWILHILKPLLRNNNLIFLKFLSMISCIKLALFCGGQTCMSDCEPPLTTHKLSLTTYYLPFTTYQLLNLQLTFWDIWRMVQAIAYQEY